MYVNWNEERNLDFEGLPIVGIVIDAIKHLRIMALEPTILSARVLLTCNAHIHHTAMKNAI